VFRAAEVVAQLGFRDGLEVAERLVEPDPQAELAGPVANLLR
jgi:hypothetical protein